MKFDFLKMSYYLPAALLALIMILTPHLFIYSFNFIVAVVLILNGTQYLIRKYLQEKSFMNLTALGVINVLFGLWILFSDANLINILPIIVAIGCMIYSMNAIIKLLQIDNMNNSAIFRYTISGVVTFLLGMLLFNNTEVFSNILVQLIGFIILAFVGSAWYEIYRLNQVVKVKRIKKK